MRCPHTDALRVKCQAVLDVTEGMIDQQGLISFKLSQVAKEAEIANSTFYKLFESKEDLLVCCFMRNATCNHFDDFEAEHPGMSAIERVLLPIIFTFEATYFSPSFNLVRQVAVNSRVWRLASADKAKAFENRINLYWERITGYLKQAVTEGELVASDDEVRELAQAITFYLSGALSAYECRLIGKEFLQEKRQTLFRQLQNVFKPYGWREPLTLALFERVGVRVHMYYQAHHRDFNSCARCMAMQAKLSG
ncbi:TetR/AcrR family transcriptional regulator [Ferrimonas futtsuensis]|uniref:TetR/AcrR family transcriptional regulator n=1 Tax=Ferrimonas futtsuensis TaxID=364764 RepID=UPI0004190347|nr:TetR/AcrR family transcriptional regulator [Ferrimonas futtsuensis]